MDDDLDVDDRPLINKVYDILLVILVFFLRYRLKGH